MYAMGDKYGIPGLKTLAIARFQESVKFRFGDLEVKFRSEDSEFLQTVPIIYRSVGETDRGLKDVLRNTISDMQLLMRVPGLCDVLRDNSELAYDLLMQARNRGFVK